MIVRPSADSVLASAQAAAKKGPPPVHLWNPPFCGDLDIRIARDGTWFYLGTPIGRPGMVRLFSSILKKEDGRYYLVTPVEKVGIRVDDAPFVAVDFDCHAGRGPGGRGPRSPDPGRARRLGRARPLYPDPQQSGGADRPQILLPADRPGLPRGPRHRKLVRAVVFGAVLSDDPVGRAAAGPGMTPGSPRGLCQHRAPGEHAGQTRCPAEEA